MSATRSLAKKLDRFEFALHNSPITIFTQDNRLRYTWIYNPFNGLEEAEVVGNVDASFLPADESRLLEQLKRGVLEHGRVHRGLVRLTIKGRAQYYDLTLKPLYDAAQKVTGLSGIAIQTGAPEGGEPGPLPGAEAPGPNPSPPRDGEIRARLLASLSRSFAELGNDYPAVLEPIARLVAQVAGDACAIHLSADDAHPLAPWAFYHVDATAVEQYRTIFALAAEELRSSLLSSFFQEGQPAVLEDFMARPDLLQGLPKPVIDWLAAYPVHALMILPLRTPRRLLGTLTVWRSHSLHPYTPDDLTFWQDVADRAALAIENARLYAEEVQRNRQLNALHDATAALLSTLDLEVLLGRILDAALRAIPAAERGILYLVAPRTGRLEIRAVTGFADPRIRRAGLLQNSHNNQAIRERRPLLIRDAAGTGQAASPPAAAPQASHDAQQNADLDAFRSAIIAPLVLNEEVLGTLFLSSSRPDAFNQTDLHLLVSFAATTTAAMHNAMLHTELQKIAITDHLTGLYNRRGLLELGQHEIERFQRFEQPLSAIMIDIDHFKQVNDTYGHSAGDQVLCGLAERCRTLVRQMDILGRYGGEEFAIILPETDLFQASAIAERLRRAVEQEPFTTDQGPVSITVSLGATRASRNLASLAALLEHADAALYQAKQKGRNRVEIG